MESVTPYISRVFFSISSEDRYDTFVDTMTNGLLSSTCSPGAYASLQSAVTFVNKLRTEYCTMPVPVAEGTCSLSEVKACLADYGKFQALASPYQSVCE